MHSSTKEDSQREHQSCPAPLQQIAEAYTHMHFVFIPHPVSVAYGHVQLTYGVSISEVRTGRPIAESQVLVGRAVSSELATGLLLI